MTSDASSERPAWKEYEIYITRHFRRLFPNTPIAFDVTRRGLISKIDRQIDILIESRIAGIDLSIVVDCKYFSRRIGLREVEAFLSFLRDLRASKGVMITNIGYTDAAWNRATYDSKDIELRIIDFNDLDSFQSFLAIPYSGGHCAIVSAPPGWIVDANPQEQYVASFYPAGLSSHEARNREGFVYLLFSHKDSKWPDLTYLVSTQELNALEHYSRPTIEYLNTIWRDDCTTVLRVIDTVEMGDTIEYTCFLDFEAVVICVTLLTPRSKEAAYVEKLKWIAQKLIKGTLVVDPDGKPANVSV